MKKYIYILFITMILLVGCKENTQNSTTQTTTKASKQTPKLENTPKNIPTEETTTNAPEPTEAALAIREVLKNERPYIDVNNGYKETYRNELHYFLGDNNANIGWSNFTMFDADDDGQREVRVIIRNLRVFNNHVNLDDRTLLILRYYEGQVYGYQCSEVAVLGRGKYFVWDSLSQYNVYDEEYTGGGKVEFEGEKIKFTYYIYEGDKEAKEWLQNLLKDESIEIIEDSEICECIKQEGEKRSDYTVGDSNSVEDIDAYIY